MRVTFLILLLPASGVLFGQAVIDNLYIESYTSQLTTRIYEVSKFNSIQFMNPSRTFIQTYRPNSNINLGFGFNYRGLGLNFGFRFPFVNNDDEKYVKTEHFNADANIYLRKVTMTAFFEIYKGYYLSENNDLRPEIRRGKSLVKRPDIYFFTVGGSGVYVLNNRKVSYRAAFTQDEWQKKSAGSALIGAYLTYTSGGGDSNLILHSGNGDSTNYALTSFRSIDFGPTAGYMYSLVAKQHYFATVSVSVGPGLNRIHGYDAQSGMGATNININVRGQLRMALGYNSRLNYLGISYVNDVNSIREENLRLRFNTGQFRINLVHRFEIGGLGFIDKIMDTFHWFFVPRQIPAHDQ